MSDEILAKLNDLMVGQDALKAGQDALRQDLSDLRDEVRGDLVEIRREANDRYQLVARSLEELKSGQQRADENFVKIGRMFKELNLRQAS